MLKLSYSVTQIKGNYPGETYVRTSQQILRKKRSGLLGGAI